ncbi:hypothetical protein RSAG8_10969, partial [Rhizoctonia solani AG-8 WAC10335]
MMWSSWRLPERTENHMALPSARGPQPFWSGGQSNFEPFSLFPSRGKW